jgi:hypothetical protein
MIIFDRMLVGGLKFVLRRVVDAVDTEMNDDGALRESLLEAQVRHELGEITDEELQRIEDDLTARIRQLRKQAGGVFGAGGVTVEAEVADGVEATTRELTKGERASPKPPRRPGKRGGARGAPRPKRSVASKAR